MKCNCGNELPVRRKKWCSDKCQYLKPVEMHGKSGRPKKISTNLSTVDKSKIVV